MPPFRWWPITSNWIYSLYTLLKRLIALEINEYSNIPNLVDNQIHIKSCEAYRTIRTSWLRRERFVLCKLFSRHREIFSESCCIKPNLDCNLHYSMIDLCTKRNSIWCQNNRKSVITVQICFNKVQTKILCVRHRADL